MSPEKWVCPYNSAFWSSGNSLSSAAGDRSLRKLFHSSFFALIPVLHIELKLLQQQDYTKFKFKVSSGSSEIPNAFPSHEIHSHCCSTTNTGSLGFGHYTSLLTWNLAYFSSATSSQEELSCLYLITLHAAASPHTSHPHGAPLAAQNSSVTNELELVFKMWIS